MEAEKSIAKTLKEHTSGKLDAAQQAEKDFENAIAAGERSRGNPNAFKVDENAAEHQAAGIKRNPSLNDVPPEGLKEPGARVPDNAVAQQIDVPHPNQHDIEKMKDLPVDFRNVTAVPPEALEDAMTGLMGGGGDHRVRAQQIAGLLKTKGWHVVQAPA